jgi:hypothetical protein
MKKLILMGTFFLGCVIGELQIGRCMDGQAEECKLITFRHRQNFKTLFIKSLCVSVEEKLHMLDLFVSEAFNMVDKNDPVVVVGAVKAIVEKYVQLFGDCAPHNGILYTVAFKITVKGFNLEFCGPCSDNYSCTPIHVLWIWILYLRGDPIVIEKIKHFGVDLEKINGLNIKSEQEALDLYNVLCMAGASIHQSDSIGKTVFDWMWGNFLH